MTLEGRFHRILDGCQAYLVTSEYACAAQPERSSLGVQIREELHFDPLLVRSGPFLNILQRLDELTFGAVGMTMPRWVFYDCAEMPGGIFGFACPAEQLSARVLRALNVEAGYRGPVPLSMYVAIPMLEPGAWHTYTLCTLSQVAPGSGPAGLGVLTEATALQVFGIKKAYGATQWRGPRLGVHALFGPLDLLTAWTPAHSDPWTLTFSFPVTLDRIERALAAKRADILDPPHAEGRDLRWIDCDEEQDLRGLQAEIEAGGHFQIVGGPAVDGSYTRVPVCKVSTPHGRAFIRNSQR